MAFFFYVNYCFLFGKGGKGCEGRLLTGLELELPAEDVNELVDDGVLGREHVGEEDEADDDGEVVVEAKGLVEGVVVDEDGEEGEDVEEVELDSSV